MLQSGFDLNPPLDTRRKPDGQRDCRMRAAVMAAAALITARVVDISRSSAGLGSSSRTSRA